MNDTRYTLELSPRLVDAFAGATGDFSAIHMDGEFARLSRYRRRIVHGLLPVAAGILILEDGETAARRRLLRLSCQFLSPAYLDDVLELVLHREELTDGTLNLGLRALRSGTDTVISESTVRFVPAGQPGRGDVFEANFMPVAQNGLTLRDIAAGHREALQLPCGTIGSGEFQSLVRGQLGGSATPRPFSVEAEAAMAASTLIGMRLPGRHATFLDLDMEFTQAPMNAKIVLEGIVESISTATGRMRLGLAWIQDGHEIARGRAAAVVNRPAPPSVNSGEIRDRHLQVGLAGKVALVTGASRGIGEATAKLLAMHGARVVVHYFRGQADAAAIVKDISSAGGEAFAWGADLRNEEDVDLMFAAIAEQWGGIDILVNNAVEEFSATAFDKLKASDYIAELSVSLFGLHTCCKNALKHMRSRRGGKIVNLGTVATEVPAPGLNKYITAKSALVGYTRSLAVECARDNIQVNLVVPQMTDTTLLASIPSALISRMMEERQNKQLLQPIDVAKVIAMMVSDWAGPISGQQIVLNQGETPFL